MNIFDNQIARLGRNSGTAERNGIDPNVALAKFLNGVDYELPLVDVLIGRDDARRAVCCTLGR